MLWAGERVEYKNTRPPDTVVAGRSGTIAGTIAAARSIQRLHGATAGFSPDQIWVTDDRQVPVGAAISTVSKLLLDLHCIYIT